mgnify:FL=1
MDAVALVAGVLLGVAFLFAGGSKVAAGDSWPQQASDLGAPRWVVPILPWVEIVLGAALVTQIARRPAAVAAVALLVAFSALITLRLAQGKRPPCACFGAWSTKPLGPGDLVRNAALIVLGVLAAVG